MQATSVPKLPECGAAGPSFPYLNGCASVVVRCVLAALPDVEQANHSIEVYVEPCR
jgi:hypothetical protein